jgi:hypothetical protein
MPFRVNFLPGTKNLTILVAAIVAALLRVTPPDPRPEGRGPRLFFDFLGRESTPDAKKGEKGPRVGSSGREFA